MTKKQILLVMTTVVMALMPLAFAFSFKVEAAFNADGSCASIKFLENGSVVTGDAPQVSHTYKLQVTNATYSQNGWPGPLDATNGKTARVEVYKKSGAQYVSVGSMGSATYTSVNKQWTTTGSYKIAHTIQNELRFVFKVNNPNVADPKERDICQLDTPVYRNTQGNADEVGKCCSTNFQCEDTFGTESACTGTNEFCSSGMQCVGGNEPVKPGGQCDYTGFGFSGSNELICESAPRYYCIPDGGTLADGSASGICESACYLNTATSDLDCAINRYNLNSSNITDGANNADSTCEYTPQNFIRSTESVYGDTFQCDTTTQCPLTFVSGEIHVGGSPGQLNLCYLRKRNCANVDISNKCTITPDKPTASGGVSATITVDCLEAKEYTLTISNMSPNPTSYSSKTFNFNAGANTIKVDLGNVKPTNGDTTARFTVSALGQTYCQLPDSSYFASVSTANNSSSNSTTPADSTDFGIQNCPYPDPAGPQPAGVPNDVWAKYRATLDNRTSDQITEHTQCVSCISANRTWTAIGCVDTSVAGVFTTLVRVVIGVMGGVVLLRLIYLGYLYQTGDTKKIAEARSGIIATIAGIIVVIFSVVILRIIGVNLLDIVPPGFFGTT